MNLEGPEQTVIINLAMDFDGLEQIRYRSLRYVRQGADTCLQVGAGITKCTHAIAALLVWSPRKGGGLFSPVITAEFGAAASGRIKFF